MKTDLKDNFPNLPTMSVIDGHSLILIGCVGVNEAGEEKDLIITEKGEKILVADLTVGGLVTVSLEDFIKGDVFKGWR